jgi:hypothetical protein
MGSIDETLAGDEALQPPANHSPKFLPPLQPTPRTGTEALGGAALAWFAP